MFTDTVDCYKNSKTYISRYILETFPCVRSKKAHINGTNIGEKEQTPHKSTYLSPNNFAYGLQTLWIWNASSRAGTNINAIGPVSPRLLDADDDLFVVDIPNGGCIIICRNMGNTYANVLPLPVLAIPITSRPANIHGIHCACIGYGVVMGG